MPIFELRDQQLIQFDRESIAENVYEQEIESLLWNNIDTLTGESLFLVARQTRLPGGGIPDIVALDADGSVIVIEVKRDVDRNQLAQTLEYAGWARQTSLDDLAKRYRGGEHYSEFWEDWAEFTDTDHPRPLNGKPTLYLVARSLHERTKHALDFLREYGLPIKLMEVAFHKDPDGRRTLLVELSDAPVVAPARDRVPIVGPAERDTTIRDVARSVGAPVPLLWVRPRAGQRFEATLSADGTIVLSDGRSFNSPSGAACAAAGLAAYDGWHAWRVVADGRSLHDVRIAIAEAPLADQTDSAGASMSGERPTDAS